MFLILNHPKKNYKFWALDVKFRKCIFFSFKPPQMKNQTGYSTLRKGKLNLTETCQFTYLENGLPFTLTSFNFEMAL